MRLGKLTLMVAGIAGASAQEFEVASVKPSPWYDGVCPQSIKLDRGRVVIECATVRTLIGYAFRFSPERIAERIPERIKGPEPMMGLQAPRFDIGAKIPPGTPVDRVPEMLQALLADRFKLALHRGNTRQEIYALVEAKSGIKLNPAGAADLESLPGALDFFGETRAVATGSTAMISNPRMGTVLETEGSNRTQQWHARSISLPGLADLLDKVAPLSSPIIDMTGLQGRYELILQVSLRERTSPADMEASILTAFNDGLRKLGLQLEHRTASIESLIVDHVEKMPTGN
jgi:uncharacterized protein (TIGR03435 family)